MPLHAIAPDDFPDTSPPRQPSRPLASRALAHAITLRNRISISRLGKYSDKRAEDLKTYCLSTPIFRVMLVTSLIPWPALILELLCESIPLQDPAEGWNVNYGMWSRLCIIITSAVAGSLFQVRSTTPELSNRKIGAIAVATGWGSTLALMLLASSWVFPLPFLLLLMCVPGTTIFVPLFLIAVKGNFRNIIGAIDKPLKFKVYLVLVQAELSFIYTAFGVIFLRCRPEQQFGLILFLPAMKLALKHLVARLVSDNEESIPAVVAFTVDVFNGLFCSICTQSSRSWWTPLLMIAMNLFYTTLSLLEINGTTRSFLELEFQNVAPVIKRNSRRTRWRSTSLLLSDTRPNHFSPVEDDINIPGTSTALQLSSQARKRELSSEMLFRLEYRVLVGYIDAVIPLLYAAHVSIVFFLPSSKYYPQMHSTTSEQLQATVGRIVVYALTEVVFLVWLHIVLKRKLGFSLIHQLAFVLETETELLQGRFFVWIIIWLQVNLVHFGMDYSFRFEWMAHNKESV